MSPAKPPTNATRPERGGPEYPVGTPLTQPRLCPACHLMHPVGTTCAGGAFPWDGVTLPPYGTTVTRSPVAGVIITLTPDELAQGIACGKHRFATKQGRDRLRKDEVASHIVGATGERAYTRWLNDIGIRHPWVCTNHEYNGKDDVAGVQVRTQRKSASGWGTKVKENDPDSRPVASLVELEPGGLRYLFRGWIWAGWAKRPDWRKDPGNLGIPNWFAPDDVLLDPADIIYVPSVRARLRIPPFHERVLTYCAPSW